MAMTSRQKRVGLVGAVAIVVVLGFVAVRHKGGGPNLLTPGTAACGHLREIPLPTGAVLCTHGPDPAPAGLDLNVSVPPVTGSAPGAPGAPGGPDSGGPGGPSAPGALKAPCYGDGESGLRVQAMYVHLAGRADRFAQYESSFRQWAAEADGVVAASAKKTGGVRHIRFVTDRQCQVVVENLELGAFANNFDQGVKELAEKGYDHSDRRYMVWMDAAPPTSMCGIGSIWEDTSPGQSNLNNGSTKVSGAVAFTYAACWGMARTQGATEAHELVHNLGGVQLTAPHATQNWHCTDEYDLMCYADGGGASMEEVCEESQQLYYDCNDDDYFNTEPSPGSYLAKSWNAANSAFLSKEEPGGSSTTTTTTGKSSSTTTTTGKPGTSTTGARPGSTTTTKP